MTEKQKVLQVGLVMPISAIDGCSAEHWSEVKTILIDAIKSITPHKFETKLVSDADDVGVIQKRIIQNVYNSDIVVCDVSCKNANVMFELGMRLAFDKPTIIIKDDMTSYSFDTQVIEHLEYPRDLRFKKILEFQTNLARKIVATYDKAAGNPNHSTFLKNFGEFKVAELSETTVTADKLILEMLADIQSQLRLQTSEAERNRHQKYSNELSIDAITAINSMETKKGLLITVRESIITYISSKNLNMFRLSRADFVTPDLLKFVETYVSERHITKFPLSLIKEMILTVANEIIANNDDRPAS